MQEDAYDQELRAIRSSRHGLRLTAFGKSAGSACRKVCKSPMARGCAMCRIQHKMMLSGNLVDAYGVVTPLPGGGEGVSGSYEESQDTPGCVLTGDTTRDERRIDCVRDPESGWESVGPGVLEDDLLKLNDLSPSEIKHRILVYCTVRYQAELSKQPACYDALSDYILGKPEAAHVRWEWDDLIDHDSESESNMSGRAMNVDAIVENYLQNLCLNSGDSLSQEDEEELCKDFL
ncbi:hypothetical protein GUITHDRAFT_132847 [Guillardia theta CCMP2712]|uniref:Uncharacterized protein n=2 Tax=Guillardia theta TaxID=55529 RepID=L1K0B9_GUITC|nr:hypothetical protein GUITHDRAFT_132847 [Guillardia theta CCMP2712]EKX53798.1 hypothetical protein GUITHDRAFT_132847 [Guillardia theta CCMP2712]|eukprot:XP_005840778.1 hypothetical protein GUITHDRAFT_132847 [Guillardia theta CCMP2712]